MRGLSLNRRLRYKELLARCRLLLHRGKDLGRYARELSSVLQAIWFWTEGGRERYLKTVTSPESVTVAPREGFRGQVPTPTPENIHLFEVKRFSHVKSVELIYRGPAESPQPDEGVRLSDKFIHRALVTLGQTLQLNVFNCSTFACDSLLNDYPYEERPLIRYYYSGGPDKVESPVAQNATAELLPVLMGKVSEEFQKVRQILKKTRKAFVRNFGVGPKIHKRGYATLQSLDPRNQLRGIHVISPPRPLRRWGVRPPSPNE